MTTDFLLQRGSCCHNGCLNCPYGQGKRTAAELWSALISSGLKPIEGKIVVPCKNRYFEIIKSGGEFTINTFKIHKGHGKTKTN